MSEKSNRPRADDQCDNDDSRDPASTLRLSNLYLHLRVARGNDPDVRFGNEAHALSKAISLTWHCNDVAVLFVVSQGFSESKDVASKVGLLHESVRPDGFHELVLRDYLVAVAH